MKSTFALFFIFLAVPALANLLEAEKKFIEIYQKNAPSVVNVSNIQLARDMFWGMEHKIPAGAGSGFVWDDKGHIVTNYHVVHGRRSEYRISFKGDKKEYEAEIVGSHPPKDIAVLRVKNPPKNLKPISIGRSEDLQVGQMTIAIGNPFGFDHTMTRGIISATGRKIESIAQVEIHDVIQTDAAINPGNSGGPLLDSQGRLIGMNTMIVSRSGSSSGLGFAVPTDTIKRVVPQLIKHGKVIRPALGIHLLSDAEKSYFNVDKGIVIKSVMNGGPADKAGLKGMSRDKSGYVYLGDIILAIDDHEINSYDDIFNIFEKYKPGQEVQVKYKRGDNLKVKDIKLDVIKQ